MSKTLIKNFSFYLKRNNLFIFGFAFHIFFQKEQSCFPQIKTYTISWPTHDQTQQILTQPTPKPLANQTHKPSNQAISSKPINSKIFLGSNHTKLKPRKFNFKKFINPKAPR